MTNAELLAKIKAEIERRLKNGEKKILLGESNPYYDTAVMSTLANLLSFISSLESEKPMNQEELEKELRKEIAYFAINGGSGDDTPTVGEIARHFAKWGAEHLKK